MVHRRQSRPAWALRLKSLKRFKVFPLRSEALPSHQPPEVNYLGCFENDDLPCSYMFFHVVCRVSHHSRNGLNNSLQVLSGVTHQYKAAEAIALSLPLSLSPTLPPTPPPLFFPFSLYLSLSLSIPLGEAGRAEPGCPTRFPQFFPQFYQTVAKGMGFVFRVWGRTRLRPSWIS